MSRLDVITRQFLISGRVQGVAFRYHTRVEAQRLGLRGVARNLPDGTVEVIAHGEAAAIEELEAWLRHGPSTARVTAVQEYDCAPELHAAAAAATDFAVR